MVQDEQRENDRIYEVEGIQFVIDKEEEKEVSHLEIDFQKEWWGEDFIITAGF